MGLYDGIKDVAKALQKADNIDLYMKLLSLCEEALDMQSRIQKLQEENSSLKQYKAICDEIEYYPDPYITKRTDNRDIRYCAACWADKQKLVPLQRKKEEDRYMQCPLCKTYITKCFDAEDVRND